MSETLRRAAELALVIKQNPDKEEMADDIDFLEDKLEAIPRYFSSVISHEIILSVSRFRLDAEQYQAKCEMMDSRRRMEHEIMTSAINKVNRLCKIYGVAPVFVVPGEDRELDVDDINDRANAALYAYGFCKEIFADNIHEIKGYTEKEISQELYEYALGSVDPFKRKITLDELIQKAQEV